MRLKLKKHLVETLAHMDATGMSRREIRKVLRSNGGMRRLVAEVRDLMNSDSEGKKFETATDNANHRGALIAWLWAHREAILKIVMKIAVLLITVV